MTEKSYVSLETSVCPVCGKEHETGIILLDRHLSAKLEHRTFTGGYSLCPDHAKDGFLCLIEASNPPPAKGNLRPSEAERTGNYAHLRRTAAERILSPCPPEEFAYVDTEAFVALCDMAERGRP